MKKSRVITIIGSVGKTSTTEVLRTLLVQKGRHQNIGNHSSYLAANILHYRPWDKHVVLEVGIDNPFMMQSYAAMCQPDIVVVTAIADDHNRSFPTLEDTREEKVKMVKALTKEGLAVLNGDDPNVMWMATQTDAQIKTFGLNSENDVYASDVKVDVHGTTFKVHVDDQSRDVRIKYLGEHFVYAFLPAIVVGLNEGMDLDGIISKIEQTPPYFSRMEIINLPNDVTIIEDSFKGTASSFRSSFNTFKKLKAKRKILVMGNIHEAPGQKRELYRQLGEVAGRFADLIIYVGDNNYKKARVGATNGGFDRSKFIYAGAKVLNAIETIKREIKPGDLILVEASGMQRLRRIVPALKGREVGCSVKYCAIDVVSCDKCPLLKRNKADLSNYYVQRFLRT